jgi:hypothetical protein
MYLPDGVEYPGIYEPLPDGVQAVAVGWLDADHVFNVGAVSDEFIAQPFEACQARAAARTRGWHRCDLCPHEDSHEPTTVSWGAQSLAIGDAEVHAVTSEGTWLVAPTLVLHYVTAHDYLPPPEFVQAILDGRFAG